MGMRFLYRLSFPLFLAALLTLPTGCGSTGTSTAVKIATEVEAATTITVDGAMKGWADWVNAGKATAPQVTAVHAAYDKYYAAQLIVKGTLEHWASDSTDTGGAYQQAKASEDAAKQALLDLINSFMKV